MIVAALSVQQFLIQAEENFIKIWRTWAEHGEKLFLGDIVVFLVALGSTEYANTKGNMEQFCNEHGLRYKAVIEARKLRVQLTNELNVLVPDLTLSVDPTLKPPTDDQAGKLRQIVLSGMVDQVAQKLCPKELKEAGLSAQKAAHTSVLRKKKPDLIVYQEVYQINDKLYARGVTAIQPEWLPLYAAPLCNISEPLKKYPPFYKESAGRVMCYNNFLFGRSGWKFDKVTIEYPGEDRYQWFARFFLQGNVCSILKEYVSLLKDFPDYVFSNRTSLVDRLEQKKVHSRGALLECWKLDEKYLLEQYLKWLPISKHEEVEQLWPPV